MYGSHILDGVLLSALTKKINILHHIYILQSFWFHLHDLQLYKKYKNSKWDPLPSYLFWSSGLSSPTRLVALPRPLVGGQGHNITSDLLYKTNFRREEVG